MDWQPIDTAPKDGTLIPCWAESFVEPCFLVWKTNPRIVEGHSVGQDLNLSESYFGDPIEMDDYELAEVNGGPTHWCELPPLPNAEIKNTDLVDDVRGWTGRIPAE